MIRIFHHNDNDGSLCATIALKKYPDAICTSMNYRGEFPVQVIEPDDIILILDYSITAEVLEKIKEKTKNITWIDHHHGSLKIGEGIAGVRVDYRPAACQLCWEYFFQDKPMPRIVELVSDHDTWALKFGNETKFTNLALSGRKLEDWKNLIDTDDTEFAHMSNQHKLLELKHDGKKIHEYLEVYYKGLQENATFETTFHGHQILVCNSYRFNVDLFKGGPDREMRATFYVSPQGYYVTLYSETVDCSEIAKQYGGGGHRSAAGFVTTKFPFNLPFGETLTSPG